MEKYLFGGSVYYNVLGEWTRRGNFFILLEVCLFGVRHIHITQELICVNHWEYHINYTSDTQSMWHLKIKHYVTMNHDSKDNLSANSATIMTYSFI